MRVKAIESFSGVELERRASLDTRQKRYCREDLPVDHSLLSVRLEAINDNLLNVHGPFCMDDQQPMACGRCSHYSSLSFVQSNDQPTAYNRDNTSGYAIIRKMERVNVVVNQTGYGYVA
jgi:hypothetical protein